MTTRSEEWFCPTCGHSYGVEAERCPEDGSALIRLAPEEGEAEDTLPGTVLDGRFEVGARIGEGGMGAVYEARQLSVDRRVAVKVISHRDARRRDVVKRFLREARLASRIQHPNTVMVLDFGQTEEGLLYLVMELLEGRTLAQAMLSDGTFSPSRALHLCAEICDALAAAHTLGIVHRDLKPGNIMLLTHGHERERVKVLDFGLAKSLSPVTDTATITRTGTVCGTPAYLPPESVTGGEVDGRADLYSLGVVLYEMLAGTRPFHGDSSSIMLKHVHEAPPRLESVPEVLQNVVHRLLEKTPEQRYATAGLTAEILRATKDRLSSPAQPPTGAPVTGDMETADSLPTPDRVQEEAVDDRALLVADSDASLSSAPSATPPPHKASPSPPSAVARPWLPWLVAVGALVTVLALWLAQTPEAPQSSPPAPVAPAPTSPVANETETRNPARVRPQAQPSSTLVSLERPSRSVQVGSETNGAGTAAVVAVGVENTEAAAVLSGAARPAPIRRARHEEEPAHDRRMLAAYPEQVRLELRSEASAIVTVQGEEVGRTGEEPLWVWVPYGSERVVVRFSGGGRQTVVRRVKPDRWHDISVRRPRLQPRSPAFIVPGQ